MKVFTSALIPFCLALALTTASAVSVADDTQQAIVERAGEILLADPETILRARKMIQQSSAARTAPIVDDFSDVVSQEVLDLEDIFNITLEPDGRAPRIHIARYQSSAVSFVDAYGNPWPIRRISNFLEGQILIDRASGDEEIEIDDPQAGSFTMTALRHGVVGNITVYLQGLSTPISILLEGKSGIYHRIATMRVSETGPQTNVTEMFSNTNVRIGAATNADLNSALYGVTPLGATQMVLTGAEGRAWIKDDLLYVQTPLAVFSPDILAVSHGNGGYRAYELPLTTTVMGTNSSGQTVTMRIERNHSVNSRDMGVAR